MNSVLAYFTRFINAIRRQADAPVDDTPKLNRAQRRALANHKIGEQRMRLERTFIAQAKRRSSKRGDHGAKSARAYKAGIEKAVAYFNVRLQQAYVQGLTEGRKQTAWWIVPRKWARKATQ